MFCRRYSIIFILILIASLSSCRGQRFTEFTRYHDDGKVKPSVALLPVINHSCFDFPWDISKELTQGVRKNLLQTGALFLPYENAFQSMVIDYSDADIAKDDFSKLSKLAPDIEFAVLMELLDHKEEAYHSQTLRPVYPVYGEVASVLKMSMRIKVFDLRYGEPRAILQEIVHSNHMISKEGANADYHKVTWKTDSYKLSPYGLAHARIERDVSERLQHYIIIARSAS